MIQSRRRISLLTLGVLSAPGIAAQEKKPARIAVVSRPGVSEGTLQIFRDVFRDLGHVEGVSYVLELRRSGGTVARLREFAKEVVASKPDVIFATHGEAAEAVVAATSTIPIVFISLDIDGLGVASYARPGGNTTGIVNPLNAKKVEIFHEMIPTLRRLAYLHAPGSAVDGVTLAKFKAGASDRGLEFLPIAVPSEDELEAAFETAVQLRADGLMTGPSAFFNNHGPRMVELAAKYRLPAMYDRETLVEAGGLVYLGPDRRPHLRRIPVLVDRILKGAKPGDLPIELPTHFLLWINLRTARALGLAVPPAILARADRIFE